MKTVAYWTMHVVSGRAGPTDEVDEVHWMSVAEAMGALSYEHDRRFLAALRAADGLP